MKGGLFSRMVVLWMLLCPRTALGQAVALLRGEALPMRGRDGDLFLEQGSRLLYQHGETGWEPVRTEQVDSVEECHGYFVVHAEGGLYLLNYLGRKASPFPIQAECGPEGLVFWTKDYWVLAKEGESPVEFHPTYDRDSQTTQYAMYLRGRIVVTAWVGDEADVPRQVGAGATYVGWGLRTTKGEWVIAPKFDAPFCFRNGVAEVLYYGQRKRIDLQGEFVD